MNIRFPSRLLVSFLACLILIACSSSDEYGPSSPSTPPPAAPPVSDPNNGKPVVTPNGLEPTLVKNYYVLESKERDGTNENVQTYRHISYRPLNSYGWDRLEFPDAVWVVERAKRADWLHINLNRGATVVVAWKGETLPSWLDGWKEVASVEGGRRSFERVYKQSETVVLGGGEEKGHYYLLIGEADGSKPVTPPLPEGITERPVANERCPDWVHDQYVATNPQDGRVYRTWHPSIDPVYWCYFEHEHGSDPSLVSYTPYFGYTAAKNSQNERHEGFKGFAFKQGETNWYMNVHATSGLDTRVCTQLHTVVMAATDDSGKLLAELSFKADFGEARANTGNNALITNSQCPQKPLEAADTPAEKRVRIIGQSGYKDENYEQWKFIGQEFLGLGVGEKWHHVTLDIRNPVTGCDGLRCNGFKLSKPDAKEPWAERGDMRTLRFNGALNLRYSKERDMTDGKEDGYFYTDAKATKYLDASDENAVRQYVSTTLIIEADDTFGTRDAWRGFYNEGMVHHLPGFKLENSIGPMN